MIKIRELKCQRAAASYAKWQNALLRERRKPKKMLEAASFNKEELQGFAETNSATEGRQNYSLLGTNEGSLSTFIFTSEQSLPFLDDADAVDASQISGGSLASVQLAARNQSTPAAAGVAFPKKRMRKAAGLRAAAAIPLLLVFVGVSVAALAGRRRQAATAAAGEQAFRSGHLRRLSWVDADAAVAAADEKVSYLVKLEARASELAEILEGEEAAHILQKITDAVEACKTEAEAFHQNLRWKKQQQQEQEDKRQQADQVLVGGWARLSRFYSAAVEEADRLLAITPAFLHAQAGAASDAHLKLMKMHVPVKRLCQKAALEVETKLGESLLRVSEFAASESLKQVHAVHEASAHFVRSLAAIRGERSTRAKEARGASATTRAAAPSVLESALEQAVTAAQVATRGKTRTTTLLRDSTELFKHTQKALILLSQSHTARLAVELVSKKVRMDLTCLELQRIRVPEALDESVQQFVLTAQEVEVYVKEMQQLQQQLQQTSDATEALSCFRRAHGMYDAAVTQMDDAPAVFVTLPFKEAAAGSRSATGGPMILNVAGESALVQQEEQNEEQRRERLRKLGAEVNLAADPGWRLMLEGNGLATTVLNETRKMLQEHASSPWFRAAPSSDAGSYAMWKHVEADAEKANKQLEQTLQQLANVTDAKRLQVEAKKTLNLKAELAGLCVDAVRHAADCKAWALAERLFLFALADHAKAANALTRLQQQRQERHQDAPEVSFGSSLMIAFKEAFEDQNLDFALNLVSQTREETQAVEDYVQKCSPVIAGVSSDTISHPQTATTSAAAAAAVAAGSEEAARDAHAAANELLHPRRQEAEVLVRELQKRRTQQSRQRTTKEG
ncbi:hypothetical protein ACSSS7_002218 [Eimeria intestinalis]